MASDDKTNPTPAATGISAAAITGARQGEQEQSSKPSPDNAEPMARPAPGMSGSPADRTDPGAEDATVRMAEIGGDQVADDDDAAWRRAGGDSSGEGGDDSGKRANE